AKALSPEISRRAPDRRQRWSNRHGSPAASRRRPARCAEPERQDHRTRGPAGWSPDRAIFRRRPPRRARARRTRAGVWGSARPPGSNADHNRSGRAQTPRAPVAKFERTSRTPRGDDQWVEFEQITLQGLDHRGDALRDRQIIVARNCECLLVGAQFDTRIATSRPSAADVQVPLLRAGPDWAHANALQKRGQLLDVRGQPVTDLLRAERPLLDHGQVAEDEFAIAVAPGDETAAAVGAADEGVFFVENHAQAGRGSQRVNQRHVLAALIVHGQVALPDHGYPCLRLEHDAQQVSAVLFAGPAHARGPRFG